MAEIRGSNKGLKERGLIGGNGRSLRGGLMSIGGPHGEKVLQDKLLHGKERRVYGDKAYVGK